MNEGKRKIGEYTVLCSVNVGEKEVILASKEQSTNGDKFMCGFAERNDLFELCSECMVSDDYIEIVHLFGSRVANEAELLLKDENAEVLLPHFSCHSLRHTFTTRMCEAGVNVKVIQDTLGHKDISTTLNIYTDVTKELRKSEFEGLDSYFKNEYNKVSV